MKISGININHIIIFIKAKTFFFDKKKRIYLMCNRTFSIFHCLIHMNNYIIFCRIVIIVFKFTFIHSSLSFQHKVSRFEFQNVRTAQM